MSQDSEMDNLDDSQCSMVDDEAYEPTYAEAFPPLPVTPDTVDPLQDTTVSNRWATAANKMALRASVITQVSSSQTLVINGLNY